MVQVVVHKNWADDESRKLMQSRLKAAMKSPQVCVTGTASTSAPAPHPLIMRLASVLTGSVFPFLCTGTGTSTATGPKAVRRSAEETFCSVSVMKSKDSENDKVFE